MLSLSSYLGTMAPKSTRDVSFSLTPSAGFTGGVANITVNSVGTGADTNKAVTGMSTTISVPVSQPDRFELGQLELSDSITLVMVMPSGRVSEMTTSFRFSWPPVAYRVRVRVKGVPATTASLP